MGEETILTALVLEKVKEASVDGHLSCPKARRMASDLKVAPSIIGQACNELNIKIGDCELGCF